MNKLVIALVVVLQGCASVGSVLKSGGDAVTRTPDIAPTRVTCQPNGFGGYFCQ